LASHIKGETTSDEIASVCLAINTAESAAYLLKHLPQKTDAPQRRTWIEHIARHGSFEDVGALAKLVRSAPDASLARQVGDLKAVQSGQQLNRQPQHPELRTWAASVAAQLLDQVRDQ